LLKFTVFFEEIRLIFLFRNKLTSAKGYHIHGCLVELILPLGYWYWEQRCIPKSYQGYISGTKIFDIFHLSIPHSWLITRFVTRVTQRVSHLEQELPIFPEHLSSPPCLRWGSCWSIFGFLCNVLLFVVCPFSFLAVGCIVCFRFAVSDYLFGIYFDPRLFYLPW